MVVAAAAGRQQQGRAAREVMVGDERLMCEVLATQQNLQELEQDLLQLGVSLWPEGGF